MIADRLDLQRTEHAVARILAETDHPVDAYAAVLQAIGTSLGWELGAVWEVDPDDGKLRCVRTWHAGDVRGTRVRGAERTARARSRRGSAGPRGRRTESRHG